MTATNKSYDFAYTRDHTGTKGRFHHVTYALDCREEILRAADIFLENGVFIETGPHKHAIQQTFFLYVYEPGGNRVEVANAGARLVLAPDWKPIVWTEAERKKGQAWGLKTIESFHTHGTPPVEQKRAKAWPPPPSHHHAALRRDDSDLRPRHLAHGRGAPPRADEDAALRLGIARHDPDRHRRDVRQRRRRGNRRRGGRRPARRGVHRQQGAALQCLAQGRDRGLRAQPEAAQDRPYRSLSAALARLAAARGDPRRVRRS